MQGHNSGPALILGNESSGKTSLLLNILQQKLAQGQTQSSHTALICSDLGHTQALLKERDLQSVHCFTPTSFCQFILKVAEKNRIGKKRYKYNSASPPPTDILDEVFKLIAYRLRVEHGSLKIKKSDILQQIENWKLNLFLPEFTSSNLPARVRIRATPPTHTKRVGPVSFRRES